MLYRLPMTSLRHGWMELPNVGDLCFVVIQKWLYHILCYDPTSPSMCLIWYPELWLCNYICALDKNNMNAMYVWASVSYLFFDMFWNASYASEIFIHHWYTLKCFIYHWYALKYSIYCWYALEHFILYWYAPITLYSICYEPNMFWMKWHLQICI